VAFKPYAATIPLRAACQYLLVPSAAGFVVVHDVLSFYSKKYVIVDPFIEWANAVMSEDFSSCICHMAIDAC